MENYYDVRIEAMDHNGNYIGGECRSLYLHKDYIQRLFKAVDELKSEEWRNFR